MRQMRRKELEITDTKELLELLAGCEYLSLGLCGQGRPYVVPMDFGFSYDENAGLEVYLHCAKSGRKMDIIKDNPKACFSAQRGHRVVPNENPANWTAHFESIYGEGSLVILQSREEKTQGLNAILAHSGYNGKPEYTAAAVDGVAVLKLTVNYFTGKRKGQKI